MPDQPRGGFRACRRLGRRARAAMAVPSGGAKGDGRHVDATKTVFDLQPAVAQSLETATQVRLKQFAISLLSSS